MTDYNVYYEPFVGAGAVLFDLQPKKAVINDFNEQLILTYKAIKNNLDDLILRLEEHKKQNSKEYYYQIREADRDVARFKELPDVDKAARLIYLNKTCFNGLYRVNSQGFFNVPYGSYKNPVIYEPVVLKAVRDYLQINDICILNSDFANAVYNAGQDAFVYFDPPYHSNNSTNFTGYQAEGFDEEEQKRLFDVFRLLTQRGAKCLLSNADTEFIRKLYQDFPMEVIQASRVINSNADGRGKVNELLVWNW